jgi:hypothetical protein
MIGRADGRGKAARETGNRRVKPRLPIFAAPEYCCNRVEQFVTAATPIR